MAEGDGLLNRYTALKPYRGFESLRLRFSLVDFQRFAKARVKNLKDLKDFFGIFRRPEDVTLNASDLFCYIFPRSKRSKRPHLF